MKEVFTNSWFESGEHVPSILMEATEAHKMNSTLSLEEIATDYLIKRDLEKWKMILLITCQWMRTKVIDRRSEDLSTVLESLDRRSFRLAYRYCVISPG